jgi:prepilin-type N-terminal cleavage/methylation domain-containing protein
MTRRAGFTLIELLVVIIIIAVMAGSIVPAYSRLWAKSRFRTSVEEVRDAFLFARERAVASDSSVIVMFNPQEQSLTVTVAPALPVMDQPVAFTATPDANAQLTPQEPPRTTRLGLETMITEFTVGGINSGALSVRFRGDGTCDGAQVKLASDSGYTALMTLWPATGRVTVEEQ